MMKCLFPFLFLLLTTPLAAQQKTNTGQGYAKFITPAMACIGTKRAGEVEEDHACVEAALLECAARAGVYGACLDALAAAFIAAQPRVQAHIAALGSPGFGDSVLSGAVMGACEGLDPACEARRQGIALVNLVITARGVAVMQDQDDLSDRAWRDLLKGAQ